MKRRRVAQNTVDAAQALAIASAAAASSQSGPLFASSTQVLTTVLAGTSGDVAPTLNLTARKSGKFLVLGALSGTAGIGATDMLANLYATINAGPRNAVATLEMAGLAGAAPLVAATKTGCTLIAVLSVPVGQTLALEMSVTATGASFTAPPTQGILIAVEF